MKVPEGTIIYIGSRKYKPGDEIPDDLLKGFNRPAKPAKPAKPPKIETDKPPENP
jgi:hypothetical protein